MNIEQHAQLGNRSGNRVVQAHVERLERSAARLREAFDAARAGHALAAAPDCRKAVRFALDAAAIAARGATAARNGPPIPAAERISLCAALRETRRALDRTRRGLERPGAAA